MARVSQKVIDERRKQIKQYCERCQTDGKVLDKNNLAEVFHCSVATISKDLAKLNIHISSIERRKSEEAQDMSEKVANNEHTTKTDEKPLVWDKNALEEASKELNGYTATDTKELLALLIGDDILFERSKEMYTDKSNDAAKKDPKNAGFLLRWCKYLLGVDALAGTDVKGREDTNTSRPFLGFIRSSDVSESEVDLTENAGQYKGLSYIVFPVGPRDNKNNKKNTDAATVETADPSKKLLYAVTMNVGKADYGEDRYLARKRGTWRRWKNALNEYQGLCATYDPLPHVTRGIKTDFFDRTTRITEHDEIIPAYYQEETLAFALVDINTIEGRLLMLGLLAIYGEMRGWPTGKRRKMIFDLLKKHPAVSKENSSAADLDQVRALLESRRFVVLQGAPGTGKTYLARQLMKDVPTDRVFFEQFHAETSYSDFVYGIRPQLVAGSAETQKGASSDTKALSFEGKPGILVRAIQKAQALYDDNNPSNSKSVYLIIDEINRANLASVLGPTFYLFEPGLKYKKYDKAQEAIDRTVYVEVVPGDDTMKLSALPPNLYVIATMNTADRSLAVVDFALRRRFAWYTMVPTAQVSVPEERFGKEQFEAISKIFDDYATDEELNLKPGHAYFIVDEKMIAAAGNSKEEAVRNRLRYEVMPLIKEYLAEGMLPDAKNEFMAYFWREIGETMVQ